MSVISAKNLTVTYDKHRVIDDVSFDIEHGDVVAIVGPNGSGKTTLLKALLGFVPYDGSADVLGHSPEDIHAIADKIGYVPQVLDFDRSMPITVRELLSMYERHQDTEHINERLKMLGIDTLLDSKLGILSGGEFQRVLLGLALINKPEILFLDEPTAGIDVEGAGEIYELVQELRASDTMTIVMVSHDLDVVFKYTDKVLCINHKLVCSGIPAEAITQETIEQLYGKHHGVFGHDKSDPAIPKVHRH